MVNARNSLVITGYSGRNQTNSSHLVQKANLIPGLRVFETGGSDKCFPSAHPASLGFRFSFDKAATEELPTAIFLARKHFSCMMPNSHFPAQVKSKADCYTALSQVHTHLQDDPALMESLSDPVYSQRGEYFAEEHAIHLASFTELEAPRNSGILTDHQVGAAIKFSAPADTVFVIEAVTCDVHISD